MESFLQKRIKNYLDATGLSVTALERRAGLKVNVARNILRGQSKRPTAETLQAIANAMGCTVQDLLGVKLEPFVNDKRASLETSLFVDHPDVLIEVLQAILKVIQDNNYKMPMRQTLLLLEEIYAYSVQKNPPQVDTDFVEWFVKRTVN